MNPSQPYLLLSTVPSRPSARKIAQTLLKRKLAACINIVPHVSSFFWWQNKIEGAHELLLVIKTTKRQLKKTEQVIRSLHSYQVPEIIGWPIMYGYPPYLKWVRKSVS